MIASLNGTITYKTASSRKDTYFVVEAAGVGYKVFSQPRDMELLEVGQKVIVYTYMAVSERALDLYGFINPADKTFFSLLLDVPGVGPKSAMGILGKASMKDVQQAIIDDDTEVLTKVAGLGKKTAEKIMLALKDKVESLTAPIKDSSGKVINKKDTDAFDALVEFGYSPAEARKALNEIDSNVEDSAEKLRQALKLLSSK